MKCPATGKACETPSQCKNGCVMQKMYSAPPKSMQKRDKVRRLMKKQRGKNV